MIPILELKIDPEFQDVLPVKQSDYEKLEKSVLQDGFFTDPFITWNGFIIDGHTRYRIMQNHPEIDLKPYEQKMDDKLPDRYAVIVWIATHQESRRNLNDFEWAEIHKKAYDAQKKSMVTEKGHQFFGNQHSKVVVESDQEQTHGTTQTHAGTTATVLSKEFGKTPSQFKHSVRTGQAMDIAEELVPGFKEAIKSGSIKTSKDRVESLLDIKDEAERKKYIQAILSGEKPKKKEENSEHVQPTVNKKRAVRMSDEERELMKQVEADAIRARDELYSCEYTIDMLAESVRLSGNEFVSVLRNYLTDNSTLLVGDNRKTIADEIVNIIKQIEKIKELVS